MVMLQVVGGDEHGYSYGQYAMEHGYEIGAMSLTHYFRRDKKIEDDAEIYRRLIEIRDEYDKWLMKTLVEVDPELAPYCEDFNNKSFLNKHNRESRKRRMRLYPD